MSRVLSLGALSLAFALLVGGSALMTRAEDAPAAKGSVSGKVVNADGGAVKGATVGIINPSDVPTKPSKNAKDPAAPKADGPMSKSVVPTVTTADDGTYKLADVPAGKYIVIAKAKGFGFGKLEVEVTAGQETKAGDIKLTPAPKRNSK